jgi:tetratricopeptide (TPR) repeat protein
MTSSEALQLLAQAKGDDEKITLASVEIAVSSQPSERQDQVREAVYAAAVPHWFNEIVLARTLDVAPTVAAEIYAVLKTFSFVEPFPRYQAHNIHERSRSHLLAFLNREAKEKYQLYSHRCFECFRKGDDPHQQIEAAYHLLVSSPGDGARTIARLYDYWNGHGGWEVLQALAAPLEEHVQFQRLRNGSLAMTLGILASIRAPYQPLERSEVLLREAGEIFRSLGSDRELSIVHNRLGDIQRARGDLAGAERSFNAAMEIAKKLAESDPQDTDSERDLSVAHNKLGEIQRVRRDLAAAERSFEAAMEIAKKLTQTDPQNTEWQRDLSVAHNKLGDIQQARGDLAEAERSFEATMKIVKKLAESDPRNVQWQSDLSVSHSKLGGIQLARGDLAGAERSFEATMEIRKRLVQRDPQNTEWQRDLSVSHTRLGIIQQTRGDLHGAGRSFEAALEIATKLARNDPQNTEWQRDLSICYFNLSKRCRLLGSWEEALLWARRDLAIAEKLAEQDPSNAQWRQDVELSRQIIVDLQQESRSSRSE